MCDMSGTGILDVLSIVTKKSTVSTKECARSVTTNQSNRLDTYLTGEKLNIKNHCGY